MFYYCRTYYKALCVFVAVLVLGGFVADGLDLPDDGLDLPDDGLVADHHCLFCNLHHRPLRVVLSLRKASRSLGCAENVLRVMLQGWSQAQHARARLAAMGHQSKAAERDLSICREFRL